MKDLVVAWQCKVSEPDDPQTNLLIIGNTLFGFTPSLKVIGLNADQVYHLLNNIYL